MAHILVAEDEAPVREFVTRALAHAGHEATVVANGQRAIEAMARRKFDLLITDIRMPEVDGITLALKMAKDHPETPILMMTGFAEERQRAHNLEALIHKVISKPFSLADFLAAVKEALASRAKPAGPS